MNEIIVHHYPVSHYSEKIRRILAYKKIPWRSVEQPIMQPKPFFDPLTGGYRRVPVMQIGSDIYCDSALIARRLEQLHPTPQVIPPETAELLALIEDWADRRFMWQALLPGFVELIEFLPADVMADRQQMAPEMTKENFIKGAPHALSQALISMDHLNKMLGDRPFLMGDAFSLADAACFFVLFYMGHAPGVFAAAMGQYPALSAWFARIKEFGPGISSEMSNQEALDVARASEPADLNGGIGGIVGLAMAESFDLGETIGVTADDYGKEEVVGKLARVTPSQITLLRDDPDVGRIAVHFPRTGYRLAHR